MKIQLVKYMLKIQLLMLSLAACFIVTGQTASSRKAEAAMLQELKTASADSNKAMLLLRLATVAMDQPDPGKLPLEAVIGYLRQSIRLSDSLGLAWERYQYRSSLLLGTVLIRQQKQEEGKAVFMQLAKENHARGEINEEAWSWYQYGQALSLIFEYPKAETAFKQAIAIYRQRKDAEGEIDAALEIAYIHGRRNKPMSIQQEYLDLIKMSLSHGAYKLPDIYYFLSVHHRYNGNFNIALGYALESVKYMEASGDSSHAHNYYGELGEVYQALHKPVESIYWYKRCVKEREAIGMAGLTLYRTYGLLVMQLIKNEKQAAALMIIRDLVKRRPPGTAGEKAAIAQSMAYCFDAMNDIAAAERYFLSSRALYTAAGIHGEIYILTTCDLVTFYVKHNQYEKASFFADQLSSDDRSATNINQAMELSLFKIDSAAGRFEAAIRHFQRYKILNDTIFNEIKSRQIEELQVQYKTEKKDQEIRLKDQNIDLLIKKDQLQQTILQQTTTTRNLVLGSTILLGLLLALGYNRYRLKQKTNRRLERQQAEINQKNITLQHLVTEKDWLVKEIHHRVKNNFHTVMGLLGTQSGYLKTEEAISAMTESQQRVHAMSLIHQKLYQSENLSAIDMRDYIHELVDYLKDAFDTRQRILFHLDITKIDLDLNYAIPLGLILNEAITNAIKYAFPGNREGNISIALEPENGSRFSLIIADDGIGYPPDFDLQKHASMGINLMKGLSGDIDGDFNIGLVNGTRITIGFSYEPNSSNHQPDIIDGSNNAL